MCLAGFQEAIGTRFGSEAIADVFISYARVDRDRVQKLAAVLERRGYSVWWDHRIAGGAAFSAEIERALAGAKCTIVVWSVSSVRSEWVIDEAGVAKLKGTLLPVRLDATPAPLGFRQYQEIDLSRWDGDENSAAASALTSSIERFLHRGSPVSHADLLEERAYSTYTDAVAVLPFDNLCGDPAEQYFVDGIHEALITELSKIGSLKVISRTSTKAYAGSSKPMREIGAELAVSKLIEGSVLRLGNNLRMMVRLIDARTDSLLWADSLDSTVKDTFVLLRDIATGVVDRISVVITPEEQSRLANGKRVRSTAYDAYLKGMYHWYRLSPGDLDRALANFDAALAADPDYAPAYAGVAMIWGGLQQMGAVAPSIAAAKIKAAIDKAISLEPDLFQAHLALAAYQTWTAFDWASAERSFTRALDLNPNHPDTHAFYSHFLNLVGRPEEAERAIRRARDLDPFNPLILSLYGVDLMFWGRHEEAIEVQREVITVAPDHWLPYQAIRLAYKITGRRAEMFGAMRRMFALLGRDEVVEALREEAIAADMEAALVRAAKTLSEQTADGQVSALYVAELYDLAGRPSDAARYVVRALEERDPNLPYMDRLRYFSDEVMETEQVMQVLRRLNLPRAAKCGEGQVPALPAERSGC